MRKNNEDDYLTAHRSIYDSLTVAFKHFNAELFGNQLPEVVITLTRKARCAGYFRTSAYYNRKVSLSELTTEQLYTQFRHEIALNPDLFSEPTEKTYSTLVHEMVHLQQAVYGTMPRNGYHDKEWAGMMELVGLIPSTTGLPGGRKTGQNMSDYVETGGRYQKSYKKLVSKGDTLRWAGVPLAQADEVRLTDPDNPPPSNTDNETKRKSKTKYSCLECGLNAWAKPNVNIKCGDCELPLEPS